MISRITENANMNAHSPIIAKPSFFPKSASFFWSGVSLGLGVVEHRRDLADLGLHSRTDRDTDAAAVCRDRAHEAEVGPVAERRGLGADYRARVLFRRD